MKFLGDENLDRSAVVANCRMNRERDLLGSNGYDRELGFNPLAVLQEQVASNSSAAWLDLCCGTGKALRQAAGIVHSEGLAGWIEILGVDLVSEFGRDESAMPGFRLVEASLTSWRPDRSFDLITCVHGLHYLGDKLGLIARAVSWLSGDGLFAASLDLANFKWSDGQGSNRRVLTALRREGFAYDRRRRLLIRRGGRSIQFPYMYLGADDQAGPNYTGQPAVNSHYLVGTSR